LQEKFLFVFILFKYSRETDLKFIAVTGKKIREFGIDSFFSPGHKTPSVILEMLPDLW